MKPFEKIYTIVSSIPKGKVMTYGQVARVVGIKNARLVGYAMRVNKDTKRIPCHRVVDAKGNLRGYSFGGIKKKKEILAKEGVGFLNKHSVDLQKFLYTPY